MKNSSEDHTVLNRICAEKTVHVSRMKERFSLPFLEKLVLEIPPTRSFVNNLLKRSPLSLIAEVKKASPSQGTLRPVFDPVAIAKIYESQGAACLSILTDSPYFQGVDDDLRAVRAAIDLPLLRKDFIIDPYQIFESRVLGADCILLIMAALDDEKTGSFFALARDLGLDVLCEVHDERELERALFFSPRLVGVNNRNLKTLAVNLDIGVHLAEKIPDGVVKVAESGIKTAADIALFQSVGYTAFLVGESLLRENDIAAACQKLLQRPIDTEQELN